MATACVGENLITPKKLPSKLQETLHFWYLNVLLMEIVDIQLYAMMGLEDAQKSLRNFLESRNVTLHNMGTSWNVKQLSWGLLGCAIFLCGKSLLPPKIDKTCLLESLICIFWASCCGYLARPAEHLLR